MTPDQLLHRAREAESRAEALQYLLDEMTAAPPEWPDILDNLTAGQRRIMGALIGQPGKVMTKAQILAASMIDRPEADWPTLDVVDVQVCKIRRRLGPDSPVRIETVWGVGYRAIIERETA